METRVNCEDLTRSTRVHGTREPAGAAVLIPEVVIRKMPWKCLDCGHKWMDRADCVGVVKRGCPQCGSHRMFDCNVELIGFITRNATGERTLPAGEKL